MKTGLRLAGGALAAACVLGAAAVAGADSQHVLTGTFTETSTGAGLGYDLHGSARLVVSDGSTEGRVNVAGLDPAKHYTSHLHNAPCSTGGGGHYQHAEGGAVDAVNELWLSTSDNASGGLDSNPGGVAHGEGTTAWEARITSSATNAESIVVHEPGGARIACADLD